MSSEVETPLDMRKVIALAFLAGSFFATTMAQDSPTATPSSPSRNIRISFVPPPLEGTISLGVYDAKGKLVRVLFREADINEFTIGQDALSTTWDGRDDSGQSAPPGKYSAHGFVVGDLKVEGVGFFFNDWISSAEAPRFSRIRSIAMRAENLVLAVDLVPPGAGHVLYDVADKSVTLKDTEADAGSDPVASVAGRDGTRWAIERAEKGTVEVKQFSSAGELLRRLPLGDGEPQPKAIAASLADDRIYLLEEDSTRQRVRGLRLTATKAENPEQTVSEWKVDFEKSIVTHSDFSVVDGKPVVSSPGGSGPEKVRIKLKPNPLLNDDRATVEMTAGFDADGSFIKSADGLPLCTVSESQALRRALITLRGPNVLDVFQDDGAVIEQFRISGADQMMSFDCGGFELK